MCSVNFIDAPELVKKTIVNKELSKIKDGKNYSSDTIIDDHRFDSDLFTFVDKDNQIVYNVNAIIPQLKYEDFVYDIASKRIREKMSIEDKNMFDNERVFTSFYETKFPSLGNKTYVEYVEDIEKDIWKEESIFSEFKNSVREYIKFDVEQDDGIYIECMFNYKYINDLAINEIIAILQKYIYDNKLVFNSSTKHEFIEGKHDWFGFIIPKGTIIFDINWREINGISLINEINVD